MATQAERKALLCLGIVAVLGVGIRMWRTHHPASATGGTDWPASDTDGHHSRRHWDSDAPSGSSQRMRSPSRRSRNKISRDSTSIIDLDQASLEAIEALGVLKAGGARLIVANRDTFGPFGSITEVERIPYLTHSEIRKLARRVTFSSIPRPRNTVVPGRADPVPNRRKRSP
jgi:hypothetical protein